MTIIVGIHRENDRGDILTLAQTSGLHVKWRGKEITVPYGFESDGCSVPSILWGLISPAIHPETLRASLVHDYIYREHPDGWTKADADELFYELMIEDGFPKWRAYAAYKGVDWFGRSAWEGDAE